MTITSVLALLSFADLGLGNGLVNAVAKSNGVGNVDYSRKAISSTFFILIFIALFLGGILWFVFPMVRWDALVNVSSPIAVAEAAPTFLVLILYFLISLPLSVVEKIQIGMQRGYVNNLWQSFGAIIGLIGILIAIYFELGLPYLAGFMVGGPFIALVFNWGFYSINRKSLLPRIFEVDWSVGKNMLAVGSVFFFLQVFTIVGGSADNMIIAYFMGASSVTGYAVTKKLFFALQITQFIIAPLWPAFIDAISKNDFNWARNGLVNILKVSLLSGGLLALPLLVFGEYVIEHWVNSDVSVGFPLLLGFFLFVFVQNYGGAMSVFLNNEKLIKKQLIFVGLSAVASVFLQVLFCIEFGVEGVVYGTLVAYSIFYIFPAYKLAFGFLNARVQ